MIEVRENRAVFAIFVVDVILTGTFLAGMLPHAARQGSALLLTLCVLAFAALLPGLYGVWSFFRFRLRLLEDKVVFTPNFGPTRSFSYADILAVEISPGRCCLLGRDNVRLAVFRRNQDNEKPALDLLRDKGIPLRPDQRSARERREEREFIRTHWTDVQLVRDQKRMKWLRWILLLLAFGSLAGTFRMQLALCTAVPLISWALYLRNYPKMRFEPSFRLENEKIYLTFPHFPCAVSLLLLVSSTGTWTTPNGMYIKYSFALFFLLFLPAAVIFILRRAHWGRVFSALSAALLLGFALTPGLQYLAVRVPAEHQIVLVEDRKTSTVKGTVHYRIRVTVNGESRFMKVPAGVYHASKNHRPIILCRQTSVFGYEIWQLHALPDKVSSTADQSLP